MRRPQIALIITLSALSSLGMGLLGSIYPIFVLNRFSASVLDVGMLATVFGLVSALFKAPAGKLVDTCGKEVIFFIGVILSAIGTIAYLFAFDILHLYLIEFFFGIS
ncbi:MFS transporter [Candidatus Bathyarchaeota archaeon]|nr:MFS transporter [Candidatus Bathyarchaeota archaeon]